MNTLEASETIKPGIRHGPIEKIKADRIREAAPALFNLARKIVEGGVVYDLVLSDDTSGRLVSLFIKKVLDKVYETKGWSKPAIRFVASGQHDNQETFKAIGELLRTIAPACTLVVTEFVSSWYSIKKLARILDENKLKFDIAVLSVRNEATTELGFSSNARVYFGDTGTIGLNFYGDQGRLMSGVRKTSDSLFPKKNIDTHTKEEYGKDLQHRINDARSDIDYLAQKTLKDLGY